MAAVLRTLDRAYAVCGRGAAIEALEARLEETVRAVAPEDADPPLSFKRWIQSGLREEVHALTSSFRRTRVNDFQLRAFVGSMHEHARKRLAGQPRSQEEDAMAQSRLMSGPAAMSMPQYLEAYGAYMRVTNVRGTAQEAGWDQDDADWSVLERVLRKELDRPRALAACAHTAIERVAASPDWSPNP